MSNFNSDDNLLPKIGAHMISNFWFNILQLKFKIYYWVICSYILQALKVTLGNLHHIHRLHDKIFLNRVQHCHKNALYYNLKRTSVNCLNHTFRGYIHLSSYEETWNIFTPFTPACISKNKCYAYLFNKRWFDSWILIRGRLFFS